MVESKGWFEWLVACAEDERSPTGLRPELLGMLTGQDKRALGAIAACWELYACSDEDGADAAKAAIVALLQGMQSKCWLFARELIARAMDWSDRERLWPAIRAEAVLALEAKRLHEQQEDAEHARLGIPTRRAAVAAFVGRAITELKAPPRTRCSCGALLEDPDHQSVCNACVVDARCAGDE